MDVKLSVHPAKKFVIVSYGQDAVQSCVLQLYILCNGEKLGAGTYFKCSLSERYVRSWLPIHKKNHVYLVYIHAKLDLM